MGQVKFAKTITVTVDPSGTPEVLKAYLVNYTRRIGSRPDEFVVMLADRYADTVSNSAYRGKACSLAIGGSTVLTGTIHRIGKRYSDQRCEFTVLDNRWKINKTYVGAQFLETLDSNGLPTSFANGLPGYGADITFNANGKPNKSKTSLAFVYLGYEHNTANANYWTYGEALHWLWDNCVTDVAAPTEGWAFGGMEKKADEMALFGVPVGEAIDAILGRTRCTWTIDASGVAHIYAIGEGQFGGTQAIVIRAATGTPHAPSGVDDWEVEELQIEESTDDAIGQVDIVGGKQQREVLLGDSDFTRVDWFGIDLTPGWVGPGRFSPFTAGMGDVWSNYQQNRYYYIYLASFGGNIPSLAEYTYRYNLKNDIYEAHKIGPDLQANEQPYQMLPQLLIGRDKAGNFVNPDQENAIEGVDPLELLKQQYPDGATLDLDRGYLFARGVSPVYGAGPGLYHMIRPPFNSLNNPVNFTIAFQCAYRSYKSVTSSVPGLTTQIRRALLRDEIIHKTREATKVLMPVNGIFDIGVPEWRIVDGITPPTGATKNYYDRYYPLLPSSNAGGAQDGLPLMDMTITLPAGVITDGMGQLNEIAGVVTPYVGLQSVNGRAVFSTWRDIAVGTNITSTNANYGLTGNEIVIAVSFSDDDQTTEIAFTNRLGNDVNRLAQAFVDARQYRRPL
jgi:hypothetical protein